MSSQSPVNRGRGGTRKGRYQSNVAGGHHRTHTLMMTVQEVAFDFGHWMLLGTGAALVIILVIGLAMPRRKNMKLKNVFGPKHTGPSIT